MDGNVAPLTEDELISAINVISYKLAQLAQIQATVSAKHHELVAARVALTNRLNALRRA